MKKVLLTLTLIIGLTGYTFSQCVQCENNTATGIDASILGQGNLAIGKSSIAGGTGNVATQSNSIVLGKYSTSSLFISGIFRSSLVSFFTVSSDYIKNPLFVFKGDNDSVFYAKPFFGCYCQYQQKYPNGLS